MNPVEFHPFEMQFEVPGTDGQTVYTRRFQAPRRLIILGCGYVAQSLCRFASQLEFDIYAADDRPSFANPYTMTNAKKVICDSFPAAIEQIHPDEQDFVAIVTRGHKNDEGSRRRNSTIILIRSWTTAACSPTTRPATRMSSPAASASVSALPVRWP